MTKIYAGEYTLAVDDSGQVYVWGINGLLIPHHLPLSLQVEDIGFT